MATMGCYPRRRCDPERIRISKSAPEANSGLPLTQEGKPSAQSAVRALVLGLREAGSPVCSIMSIDQGCETLVADIFNPHVVLPCQVHKELCACQPVLGDCLRDHVVIPLVIPLVTAAGDRARHVDHKLGR